MEDAGSLCGQQTRSEEFPFFGLVSKTDLSPLDSGSFTSLCGVVGWLESVVFEEREQTVPVLEQALAGFGHIVISTLSVLLETPVHSGPDGNRLQNEGLPVQISALESMPECEHSAGLGEHPLGESDGVRASAGVLDSLDPSDDVRPAELSDTVVKLLVRGEHVRTENSLVLIAEDFFEDFRAPRGSYMEKRNHRSDECPKPTALSLRFPSGLVDVEDRLLRQTFPCVCIGVSQGLGDFLMELADGSQTDVNTENGFGYFLAAAASYSVKTGQMGKKCCEPWSET